MKNLLKNNMFWGSDDPELPKAQSPTVPAAVPPGSVAPGAPPPVVRPPTQQLFGIDPEMAAQLRATVAKRQTPYTALMDAAKLLESFIADEQTRFKAAFAQVSAGGQRSPASMVPAIDLHIGDIDNEARAFTAMMGQQITTRVESAKQGAAAARDRAGHLRQRAEDLQRQASEALTAAQGAEQEALDQDGKAGQAEAEITGVQQRFTAAVEAVKADLVAKKTYLSTIL